MTGTKQPYKSEPGGRPGERGPQTQPGGAPQPERPSTPTPEDPRERSPMQDPPVQPEHDTPLRQAQDAGEASEANTGTAGVRPRDPSPDRIVFDENQSAR